MNREQCSNIPGIDTTTYYFSLYKSPILEIIVNIDYCTLNIKTSDKYLHLFKDGIHIENMEYKEGCIFFTSLISFSGINEEYFFPNLDFSNINEKIILNKINKLIDLIVFK